MARPFKFYQNLNGFIFFQHNHRLASLAIQNRIYFFKLLICKICSFTSKIEHNLFCKAVLIDLFHINLHKLTVCIKLSLFQFLSLPFVKAILHTDFISQVRRNVTVSAFYGKDSSVRATPPSGKSFTLASQANSNTTNTTESLNSVNNVETPIQGGSSRNYSVYATEDAEDTENDDNTGPDTTSTPSRQEPLGEYQSSTTTSTKDTNIIIPILIVAAITLGTSTLGFLIYKSLRQEDE